MVSSVAEERYRCAVENLALHLLVLWVWREGNCDARITLSFSRCEGRNFSKSSCAVVIKLTTYGPTRNTNRPAPNGTRSFPSLSIPSASTAHLFPEPAVPMPCSVPQPLSRNQSHLTWALVTAKGSCANLPWLEDLWRSLPVFIKASKAIITINAIYHVLLFQKSYFRVGLPSVPFRVIKLII